MGKLRALILVSFLIHSPLATTAQNANATLQLGTPIERQLGPGQSHEFTVRLEENNLIRFVVEQRGIDVVVKVLSPTGKSVGEYDSPTGADGSEHVSFVAAAAGSYRIVVTPLDSGGATTGRYQIKILEVRPATEQELKTSKNLQVVKARGIALLKEAEEIVPQIKSRYIRIKSQLSASNLLWETDEKLAAKFLSDAIASFKEFLATVDPNDPYFQPYSTMSQLRYELAVVAAQRDPEAALSFLHSTKPTGEPVENQRERLMQETEVEFVIAEQMVRKDPKRALQLARQTLKSRYSPSLVNTISQLLKQNPEMASELANEIAAKLINEKLLQDADAAGLAVALLRLSPGSVMKSGPDTASGPVPKTPLLREAQYRELVQRMLSQALSYSPPARIYSHTAERDSTWNLLAGLEALGSNLDTVIAGGEAAIQKKRAELNAALNHPYSVLLQQLHNTIANGPAEASLEAIEKVPSELKEQLYIQLADHEAKKGDLARARQIINDNVSTEHQRRQALSNLEQQEIYRNVGSGKIDEALRKIALLRNNRERGAHLAQIISQIDPGLKPATAIGFLEQARSLLGPSPQAEDQDQMSALFEIARVFSRYDSRRSFEILDPLIDQFNEISAAAQKLEGFGFEAFQDGELNLFDGGYIATFASQMSKVLGTLALTNFDRAKAASDRIRLPEVRLRAYLDIAEQTIAGAK